MAAASLVGQSSPGGLLGVFADGPAIGQWRQDRIEDRYTDHLFADILVPLSGEEVGWHALTQALIVAKREDSRIHGLHLAPNEEQKESDDARRMRDLFTQRCDEAGVRGTLAVEAGEIANTICNRALLADLVILNLAYPPSAQPLARLGSGFRTIIRRCARPILAVPGTSTPLERVLLAYDGSPKAKEALFVATYFAEQWRASLAVVTVIESDATREALDYVRKYLEMHEVEAVFIESEKEPTPGAILKVAEDQGSHLIVMGGYGSRPVVEVVIGSSVDQVLRESKMPMLICR
jgi:nucleotide-binding universal stress UspA family protein